MDEKYANAREHFYLALRSLAASAEPLEKRLISATSNIVQITIDEFDGDLEMKVRFAKILDLLASDQDDLETVALETAAHMSEAEAVKVAALVCDFFYDL